MVCCALQNGFQTPKVAHIVLEQVLHQCSTSMSHPTPTFHQGLYKSVVQSCCIMQYCIKAFTQGLRNSVVQKSFAQKPCNVLCDRSYITWAPRTRTQSHGAEFSRTPGCHWTFRNGKTLSIWAQLWPLDRRIEGLRPHDCLDCLSHFCLYQRCKYHQNPSNACVSDASTTCSRQIQDGL